MKRASQMLEPYRKSFEMVPWKRTFLWRLTDKEKHRRGLRYRTVGASQHTDHWLALGDMWQQLVFNGIRPDKWFTEGSAIGRFDVFMVAHGTPYLVELQRTPLSKREWKAKWQRRAEWLKQQRWKEHDWSNRFSAIPPKVILITTQPMQALVPRGVLHVRRIEDIHRFIR